MGVTLDILKSKPLLKLKNRSLHQRDDISPWDAYKPAYLGTKCGRCAAPMKLASQFTWCVECCKLPTCEVCGDTSVDCDCADYEPCDGCEFGCGECIPSMRVSGHSFDRERWGCE
jgi:hypothetical protein